MPSLSKDMQVIELLPATVIPDRRFSDERLEQFAHTTLDPDMIRCERMADGKLRLFPPSGVVHQHLLTEIGGKLARWLTEQEQGGAALIRRRFFLQGGIVMSPDIAYIGSEPDEETTHRTRPRPLKMCPEFVVEICPGPEQLSPLKEKMVRWIAGGVREAWLIIPQLKATMVYFPALEPQCSDEMFLVAGHPIDGFWLFLEDIWRFSGQLRSE